jgi:tetratricopeptide (TPR) repeat protein
MRRNADRRRAAKLYLASSKLFEKPEQFEEAMRGYEQAAKLDPSNADYPLAADVARSHAVTALIQAAAKNRLRGDAAAARAALAHAPRTRPQKSLVSEHLYELGDDALLGQSRPIYEQGAETAGEAVPRSSPLPECTAFTCAPTSARSSSRSSRPTELKPPWTTASAPRQVPAGCG